VLSVNERWLEILLTPMRDQITVAETCRRYGISRQTFYVYQRRLFADGVAALVPLSRRPLRSPGQTAAELEAEIVRLRTANPRWMLVLSTRTCDARARQQCLRYRRFIVCCNVIHSSRREPSATRYRPGGVSNATHPTTCGRSTAPKSPSPTDRRRG